jgi:hypothetical protein
MIDALRCHYSIKMVCMGSYKLETTRLAKTTMRSSHSRGRNESPHRGVSGRNRIDAGPVHVTVPRVEIFWPQCSLKAFSQKGRQRSTKAAIHPRNSRRVVTIAPLDSDNILTCVLEGTDGKAFELPSGVDREENTRMGQSLPIDRDQTRMPAGEQSGIVCRNTNRQSTISVQSAATVAASARVKVVVKA